MSWEADCQFSASSLLLTLSAETGWAECQKFLQKRGYTLGWAPPLSPSATLRELLEQGAASLCSSRYGSPADNCVALSVTLLEGNIARSRVVPRSAVGPDWKHLFLGAGGYLGQLKEVTLRVYPQPTHEVVASFRFQSLEAACKAVASALQRGSRPSLVFLIPAPDGCQLLLRLEGRAPLVHAWTSIVRRLSLETGGTETGESSALVAFSSWGIPLSSREAHPLTPDSPLLAPTYVISAHWRSLPGLVARAQEETGAFPIITSTGHAGASIFGLDPAAPLPNTANAWIEDLGGRVPGGSSPLEAFFPSVKRDPASSAVLAPAPLTDGGPHVA